MTRAPSPSPCGPRFDLEAAIRSAVPGVDAAVVDGFLEAAEIFQRAGIFESAGRVAALIGQCAHESARFTRIRENLNYSAAALAAPGGPFAVFRGNEDLANRYGRIEGPDGQILQRANPVMIASIAYARRLGNGDVESRDGWLYRGGGWIQLTGRDNYTRTGHRIHQPLGRDPALIERDDVAWMASADYLATTQFDGRTLLEWADDHQTAVVTRGVNGSAMLGLAERELYTARALAALRTIPELLERAPGMLARGTPVMALQIALGRAGHAVGQIDGIYGLRTERAVQAALDGLA